MLKRILLVDTDPEVWRDIRRTCHFLADLRVAGDFPAARRHLSKEAPAFLVTNLRLGAYNGLHLVHLAAMQNGLTRSIVYSSHSDIALIDEAQRIGAFFELPTRLASALPGYLRSSLPPKDRRSPHQLERRQVFRGGRRASDVAAAV